ncbi:MAG: phosphatase PAP2 family protein [Fimbriimonadaceae bacterium]|nr:phosphatase PAP2 family protein [Fimbriimonadaceae bacterium]
MGRADLSLFYAINRWPEGWTPIMRFFSEATDLLAVRIGLVLMVVVMVALRGAAARAVGLSLLAFPIANEVTDLFKAWLPQPRPFQELADAVLRTGGSDSAGTASAHSANMAAVATVMLFLVPRFGAVWVVVAVMTGLSRIYTGVHYPGQVALGWTVGVTVGLTVVGLERVIRDRWFSPKPASSAEPVNSAEGTAAEGAA